MRRIGDIWQALGTSGDPSGTSGDGWRAFLYGLGAMAAVVGAVNIVNIITIGHEQPQYGLAGPIVWEGSSWLTFLAFAWIPWTARRLVPLTSHPRWRVPLVHAAAAVAFSFCHVAGFVLLRKLAYAADGKSYDFGPFGLHFPYELGKDVFGYALAITVFEIARFIVRHTTNSAPADAAYSIRDGARILRVPIAEILAISSAGNYVEFTLRDGRKPLMRSALSSIESEFAPHGFVRVHRSWLVNPARMTALKPEGSGDYTVELGEISVPLSRRFPDALAKLRAA